MEKFVDRLFLLYKNRGWTKTQLRRWIDQGYAKLNGKIHRIATTACHLKDRVELLDPPEKNKKPVAMLIVYEDAYFRVYEKPAGIESDVHRFPLLVHRLDKETAGLLMEAKSAEVLQVFQALFRNQQIEKRYYAIVEGHFSREMLVELPIGRIGRRAGFEQFGVVSQGKMGITHFFPLRHTPHYTLLDCSPKTGRTHQIRVHLSTLGYPIVGDLLYGKNRHRFSTMYLFAYGLKFIHPITKEPLSIQRALPPPFDEILTNDSQSAI